MARPRRAARDVAGGYGRQGRDGLFHAYGARRRRDPDRRPADRARTFHGAARRPTLPWNEGTWRFESVDGLLDVQQAAEAAADCTLHVQALAALAYGTHDPGDFAVRGWGDPSPEVQTTLRAMFPRMLPHLHELF
jgi:hypothetical protein